MFLLWYSLYFNFVRIRTVNIRKTVRLCVTVSLNAWVSRCVTCM